MHPVASISGYVPMHNNVETVLAAVDSLRIQKPCLKEVFVIDDGSTDASAEICEASGVQVIRQHGNFGRGAARARAMERAEGEFVLCVDATNVLEPDFLQRALQWFDNPKVAAVYGRIVEGRNKTPLERWRGRHLFRNAVKFEVRHQALLITYGTVVRRSAVEAVGGFSTEMRHTEDADLGERLLNGGFDVVFDPELQICSIANNNLRQTLERYWRWNVGREGRTTFRGYCAQILYSVKVMAREDLKQRDWVAAGISLLSPHYAPFRALRILK